MLKLWVEINLFAGISVTSEQLRRFHFRHAGEAHGHFGPKLQRLKAEQIM